MKLIPEQEEIGASADGLHSSTLSTPGMTDWREEGRVQFPGHWSCIAPYELLGALRSATFPGE
eukprot:11753084-Prorocentrum_lima.AAC.1